LSGNEQLIADFYSMKGKFLVILTLLLLLVFTVYQMLRYEESVRSEKVITEFIEDDTRPLIEKPSPEKLEELAERADYYFQAKGDYFQHLHYDNEQQALGWDTFLMKGVNLGVAVPGKFPAEFSLSFEEYFEWLKRIGEMNANIIRTYTILPPVFYEAFALYNLQHQDKPLFLVQGIWATVPEDHNYLDESFSLELKKEIVDVIDVLHGNAVLRPKPGKASGVYSTNVSRYVAALLFGREWEPDGVTFTNQNHTFISFQGDFVGLHNGSPMEVWLAQMMEFMVLYETTTYSMQHPVSFVNWLPLDPLYHSTEFIENDRVREYDNDLEQIDFMRFHATHRFVPGIYASYHAYPYYPDFIYLEERYARFKRANGESDNFAGYLHHLKENHPAIPLIITEYGIPSSRGNSHLTPLGLDQGGHHELEHAHINTLLTKDIFESGCGGAVFFEWADEWFKHNWLVMDFEIPFENRKLWHNMENPEQNFGILALESRKKTIDGRLEDWEAPLSTPSFLKADGDPSYFYIALKAPDLDLERHNLVIALDIVPGKAGDHRLPFSEETFDTGFEFLLEFFSRDSARILVDEPYSVYTDLYNDYIPAYASRENHNGRYIEQRLLSNRSRESLTGATFDSVVFNRSRLIFGHSGQPRYSNADWYWNDTSGVLEIRLSWHLINVTDPSTGCVLSNKPETPEIDCLQTDGIGIFSWVMDVPDQNPRPFPNKSSLFYKWKNWEQPEWQSRLKPVYDSLKVYFKNNKPSLALPTLRPSLPDEPLFLCPFYNNQPGAVSVSFDQAVYSQFEQALPILQKYNVSAAFGLVPAYLEDSPGLYPGPEGEPFRRLGLEEVNEMRQQGHQLALQLETEEVNVEKALSKGEHLFSRLVHLTYTSDEVPTSLTKGEDIFIKKLPIRIAKERLSGGLSYYNIPASKIALDSLEEILDSRKNDWIILNYERVAGEGLSDSGKNSTASEVVSRSRFEKQLRLARNKGFWLAPEWDVYRYMKQKEGSQLKTVRYKDLLFVSIEHKLDRSVFNHPMSLIYRTEAPFVAISGSPDDGIYQNRGGRILFQAIPNREIILKEIW
jgi:hypothetical protein